MSAQHTQHSFTEPINEYRLHGPPGTGKSTALAKHWIPRAVEKFGKESVVVVSLTRTAAREIASRDTGLPRENVGTLHSMGYRAIGKPGVAGSSEHIKDWNNVHPYWAQSASDSIGGGADDLHGPRRRGQFPGDAILSQIGLMRSRLQAKKIKLFPALGGFNKRWVEFKQERGLCDFSDMIEQALEESPQCPGEPKVLIVDEAQDCSELDLALIRKWGSRSMGVEYFVLAGDGDQAIYGFRGGSVRAFLGSNIPDEHNYKLTQSYRVPVAVERAATQWISQIPDRYAVEYKPTDLPGSFSRQHASTDSPAGILNKLHRNIDEKKTTMILAPCAYMLHATTQVLREAGILFHNPWRPQNGAWNPMRGGLKRLRSFVLPMRPQLSNADHARMWTWRELHEWAAMLGTYSDKTPDGPLIRGAKKAIADSAADKEVANKPVDSAILEAHVFTVDAWRELEAVCGAPDPLGMIEWFRVRLLDKNRKLFEYVLTLVRIGGIQRLVEPPRVILGTIHSVKGGQADDVMLFPELSNSGMESWMGRRERSEIVRTLYVGMTRARRNVYMLNAKPGLEVPGIYNLCH